MGFACIFGENQRFASKIIGNAAAWQCHAAAIFRILRLY
jgi:hypothetical protein